MGDEVMKYNKKAKPENRTQWGMFMLTTEEKDWLFDYPFEQPLPDNINYYFKSNLLVPIPAMNDILELHGMDWMINYTYEN